MHQEVGFFRANLRRVSQSTLGVNVSLQQLDTFRDATHLLLGAIRFRGRSLSHNGSFLQVFVVGLVRFVRSNQCRRSGRNHGLYWIRRRHDGSG